MAKIIERNNGERIIVSNNVPEDIEYEYDSESLDVYLASKILNDAKEDKKPSEAVTVIFALPEENFPSIPLQLEKIKITDNRILLSGLILTSDFFWFLEKKVMKVNNLTVRLEHRNFNLNTQNYKIKFFYAKDINTVTVRANLSLIKTI